MNTLVEIVNNMKLNMSAHCVEHDARFYFERSVVLFDADEGQVFVSCHWRTHWSYTLQPGVG